MWSNKSMTLSPLFAILIPLGIRIIPEILAGPYPIGFDTIFSYIPQIKSGYPLNTEITQILKGTNLFPLVAVLLNKHIINDPALTIKLFGPLLHGFLGLTIYLFSQKVLNWSSQRSLALVIINSLYFISLRISWEMYRQMLGTIFLLSTLICYSSSTSRILRVFTPIFSTLTILSHEIPAATLLAILSVEITYRIVKRKNGRFLIILSLLASLTLFGYRLYDPYSGMLKLPLEHFAEDRLKLAMHILGFILYSYGFLVPLIIYGAIKLKNRLIYCWLFFTLLLGIWPIMYPPAAPPLWFRWIIFMVYPLIIFSTEGFSNLLSIRSRSKKGVRIITMSYLSVIIFTSTYYIVASPEYAFPYFSEYNPYKQYIPSSMIQSTIPIEDIEPSIQAVKWISENADGLVVFHEAFYPWTVICDCLPEKYIIVREQDLSKPERVTFAEVLKEMIIKTEKESKLVYTIWWTNGKGWYNVPRLPDSFKLEKSFKSIGVYRAELG